ncbi:hypothetical protein MMC19_005147 [Ptychographa xylographoides]|nr:hypothetical protein [Ptychographa xylographoides]
MKYTTAITLSLLSLGPLAVAGRRPRQERRNNEHQQTYNYHSAPFPGFMHDIHSYQDAGTNYVSNHMDISGLNLRDAAAHPEPYHQVFNYHEPGTDNHYHQSFSFSGMNDHETAAHPDAAQNTHVFHDPSAGNTMHDAFAFPPTFPFHDTSSFHSPPADNTNSMHQSINIPGLHRRHAYAFAFPEAFHNAFSFQSPGTANSIHQSIDISSPNNNGGIFRRATAGAAKTPATTSKTSTPAPKAATPAKATTPKPGTDGVPPTPKKGDWTPKVTGTFKTDNIQCGDKTDVCNGKITTRDGREGVGFWFRR